MLDETPVPGMAGDLTADGDGSGLVVQCSKWSWCALGEGHPGRCRKTPAGSSPAPRKRTRKSPRPGDAAGSSRGNASGRGTPGRKTTPAKKRADPSWLQTGLGYAWDSIGKQIESVDNDVARAVGRCVQFEAPYAAERLHPVLRRVPVYRRLDTVSAGLLDDLAPLLAAPLLVGLIAKDPETMGPLLERPLMAALEPMVVAMVATKREQVERMEQLDALGEEGSQLMSQLFDELFGPPASDGQP